MKKSRKWTTEEHSRNVHSIKYTGEKLQDFDNDLLIISDVHWDNPKCKRDLLKKHLDEAMERDAPILINGDLFCLMQGKFDKRANKNDILPEHNKANYLQALIDDAIQWWLPYSDNLTLIGQGNHETAILKRHEWNVTQSFVEGIKNANPKSPIFMGGYSGWVKVKYDLLMNKRSSHKIYYNHGHGGGGPVTKGIIQTNRRAAMIADADIIWTGHVHEQWSINIPKIGLTELNNIKHLEQWHVCTPGYKEEYSDGFGGWHIERGAPPKPVGGYWLNVYGVSSQKCRFGFTINPTKSA